MNYYKTMGKSITLRMKSEKMIREEEANKFKSATHLTFFFSRNPFQCKKPKLHEWPSWKLNY